MANSLLKTDHPEAATPRGPLHGEIVDEGGPRARPTAPLLDLISFIMDRLVQVPGTRLRVGLNALFLLLPVLGDFIPTVVSVGILVGGLSNYRVPRIVALRMVLNTLLDTCIGWIPVLGDLFDVYFKADTRNVRLLQQYAGHGAEPPGSTWRHWLFVVGLLGLFGVILVLIVLGAFALVHWAVHALFTRG